jgi:hypothetical protein
MIENMQVEVVLRKNRGALDVGVFKDIVAQFLYIELEDRVILNFPLDWVGFRDGTMAELIRQFYNCMYIALAYFANDLEIVTDAEGVPIEKFDVVVAGKKTCKYVKKKVRTLRIIDEAKNVFNVEAYVLDTRVVPPAVKVLEIYSGDIDSGVKLADFLPKPEKGKEDR